MNKLFILLIIPFLTFGQRKYQKNSHVKIHTKETRSDYKINYTFKNHFKKTQTVEITLNKKNIDFDIDKLGIPNWMFDKYIVTDEEIKKRKKILYDGLYKQDGNMYIVDYNAVINYYRVSLKVIADYLIRYLKKNKLDNRKNRIELAMKFVQDIPYGIPSENRVSSKYGGYKYNDGIYAPYEVLINGYGDCDSKTFLFVCILSHMIKPDDIIFIKGDNHLLSGVRYNKKIGGGQFFSFEGKKYYICETAGPGRPLFGKKNTNVGSAYLYPLEIK